MSEFINWLSNPFGADGNPPSAGGLFLLIGLIVVMLAIWGLIFVHIRAAI